MYESKHVHFPATFNQVQKGNKFVQDGCPVLNSGTVKDASTEMGIEVISIPARSPDLNPVENIFNLVRRDLRKQAIEQKICNESYDAFCTRVRQTLTRFPRDIINKTIETMVKRLRQVIATHGHRIKYWESDTGILEIKVLSSVKIYFFTAWLD